MSADGFPLAKDEKAARHAFAAVLDASAQRDAILYEADPAIRAAQLLSVVADLARAIAILTPLAADASARGIRHAMRERGAA